MNRDNSIDWDVNSVRTSPIDHKSSSDSISSYMEDVANSSESIQDVD